MILASVHITVGKVGANNAISEDEPKSGACWNLTQAHDVPERTGKGDVIADVVIPFISIGSSFSSSGEIVSSDCLAISCV